MGRKIAGGIKNGFDYVKNSRAGKFLYDLNVEGKALRGLRDGISQVILAPLEGLGLEQLTENVPHRLSGSGNIGGWGSVGYGFPLIWKEVSSTFTENPIVTTTYQPLNLVGNAIIWTAIAEGANYAALKLIDKYQSRKLERKLKELEKNSK